MIPLRSNSPRPGYQSKYLHLPKRPRKSWIFDFRRSVPRKFARVWYHFELFLKLYNLSLRFKAIHRLNSGLKPSQTPTQKFKNRFFIITSLEIGSSLVSFQMIFQALQSEIFSFKIQLLSSKTLKIPESNLAINLYLIIWTEKM